MVRGGVFALGECTQVAMGGLKNGLWNRDGGARKFEVEEREKRGARKFEEEEREVYSGGGMDREREENDKALIGNDFLIIIFYIPPRKQRINKSCLSECAGEKAY